MLLLRLLCWRKQTDLLHYSTAPAAPAGPHLQPRPLVTDPTLTLYFLQKSCKLSPAAAAAAAKHINIKSTKKPHSVLSLLRGYGFTDSHIAKLISRRPKLLLSSPDRTLKPKFEFFASIGLSGPGFADIFCNRTRLFLFNVDRRFHPNLHLLRTLLPSDADLVAALRRYPSLILSELHRVVPVRTDALQEFGLPMDSILKLLAVHPGCLMECPNGFELSLASVKEMGISPKSSIFVHAFAVISKVPKPVWESRMQNYVTMGWSRDQVFRAFVRHPYCMSLRPERVKKSLEFFADKLGWGPTKFLVSPVLLSLSLEKRIVPRYSILKLLSDRGVLKDGVCSRQFLIGERIFKEMYVDRYKEMVPEILEAIS